MVEARGRNGYARAGAWTRQQQYSSESLTHKLPEDAIIKLAKRANTGNARTAVHEFVHPLEYRTGTQAISRGILREMHRLGRSPKLPPEIRARLQIKQLRKIQKNSGYGADEMAMTEGGVQGSSYTWKVYGDIENLGRGGSELVTMLVEMLYAEPIVMAREYPHLYELGVAFMRGGKIDVKAYAKKIVESMR